MRDLIGVFRNRGIVTLMAGHFTVDSYGGLLPVLYPLLIHRFALNLETVGLVSLAYSGMGSISQPVFGLAADRWGTRLTGLALVWTAVTFGVVGFAPSFPVLVAVAACSGLGSGAFHPFGALTVRGLLPSRGANTAMSIYVTGGTFGLALGPLIGVALFAAFGIRGTAIMIVPGLAFAAFLLLGMRKGGAAPRRRAGLSRQPGPVPLVPLLATIAVMGSRSWTMSSLQNFTPTWYHQLGYQPWFYGPLATTIILASCLGTMGTGSLSERLGRRTVVLASLAASVPAVALFVAFPGSLAFLWAVLVGGLAASTAPLMLMLAQELMFARAGFASGLIMGLGFVTAAIGIPVTGVIADHIGLQRALAVQLLVVLLTIPVALLLPDEAALRRHLSSTSPQHPAAGLAAGEPSAPPERAWREGGSARDHLQVSEQQVAWRATPYRAPVLDREGGLIGTAESLLGDEDDDIFHGIVVKTEAGKLVELLSAQVSRITTERIYTDVEPAAVPGLPRFEESKWYHLEWGGLFRKRPEWREKGEA